jgi:hypothetical protein
MKNLNYICVALLSLQGTEWRHEVISVFVVAAQSTLRINWVPGEAGGW